jgi:ATP-dependent Clp protease ATP-binding subunit ClpA
MNKIKIIYGPKLFLEQVLDTDKILTGNYENLSKLVQESSIIPHVFITDNFSAEELNNKTKAKRQVNNLVAESEEYSSANEHVLININLILSKYEIENIYLHNPPDAVKESIKNTFDSNIIEEQSYDYRKIDQSKIRIVNSEFNKNVFGQDSAKQRILTAFTHLLHSPKPVVLLFYGASGVGKTEAAKLIARLLEGEETSLFRRQFSMFQNNHFATYLFGGSHSEKSFTRELLERESNIILIDEFDKVDPIFHNAFYQLFDEGIFVDRNYTVNLQNSVIICTSNYLSENVIRERLGDPIYSRFDSCIKFADLSEEDKDKIVEKIVTEELEKLPETIRSKINIEKVKQASHSHARSVGNYRMIKSFISDLIAMYELTDILSEQNK